MKLSEADYAILRDLIVRSEYSPRTRRLVHEGITWYTNQNQDDLGAKTEISYEVLDLALSLSYGPYELTKILTELLTNDPTLAKRKSLLPTSLQLCSSKTPLYRMTRIFCVANAPTNLSCTVPWVCAEDDGCCDFRPNMFYMLRQELERSDPERSRYNIEKVALLLLQTETPPNIEEIITGNAKEALSHRKPYRKFDREPDHDPIKETYETILANWKKVLQIINIFADKSDPCDPPLPFVGRVNKSKQNPIIVGPYHLQHLLHYYEWLIVRLTVEKTRSANTPADKDAIDIELREAAEERACLLEFRHRFSDIALEPVCNKPVYNVQDDPSSSSMLSFSEIPASSKSAAENPASFVASGMRKTPSL